MSRPSDSTLLSRLADLQAELLELAVRLDRRQQPAAADVAGAIARRLADLAAEFTWAKMDGAGEGSPARSPARPRRSPASWANPNAGAPPGPHGVDAQAPAAASGCGSKNAGPVALVVRSDRNRTS